MTKKTEEYSRMLFKYTVNILSGQFILFLIVFIAILPSSSQLISQQNNNIENVSELDIMALHQIAQNDESTPMQLFLHCSQLGVVEYLLKEGSVLSETVLPDYILFFDGTTQKNNYAIVDVLNKKSVTTLENGNLLAVIVFEDSPNERYNLRIQSSAKLNSKGWKQLTNVTQIHTNGSPAKMLPLQSRYSTSTPYYVFRIEYYRYTEIPAEIQCEVISLPGITQHYNNFGAGVSYVWTHQPVTSFAFDTQTLTTTAQRESRHELRGDGMISIQIFPDSDPRQPNRFPWERRFYQDFFSRFGLQASMGFTRFPTYFDHWFVGGTFKLYHKLYLYSGVSFVQLPLLNSPTVLIGNQLSNPDQYMRGDYEQLFFMGISIPIFEF